MSDFRTFLASRAHLDELLGTPQALEAQFIRGSVPSAASGALVDAAGDAIITNEGITVLNGAITVTNASSVVVIDGSSDIFKIWATGTLQAPTVIGPLQGEDTVNLTSLGVLPGFAAFISPDGTSRVYASPFVVVPIGGSAVGAVVSCFVDDPGGGSITVHALNQALASSSYGPFNCRYYLYKESAL